MQSSCTCISKCTKVIPFTCQLLPSPWSCDRLNAEGSRDATSLAYLSSSQACFLTSTPAQVAILHTWKHVCSFTPALSLIKVGVVLKLIGRLRVPGSIEGKRKEKRRRGSHQWRSLSPGDDEESSLSFSLVPASDKWEGLLTVFIALVSEGFWLYTLILPFCIHNDSHYNISLSFSQC